MDCVKVKNLLQICRLQVDVALKMTERNPQGKELPVKDAGLHLGVHMYGSTIPLLRSYFLFEI